MRINQYILNTRASYHEMPGMSSCPIIKGFGAGHAESLCMGRAVSFDKHARPVPVTLRAWLFAAVEHPRASRAGPPGAQGMVSEKPEKGRRQRRLGIGLPSPALPKRTRGGSRQGAAFSCAVNFTCWFFGNGSKNLPPYNIRRNQSNPLIKKGARRGAGDKAVIAVVTVLPSCQGL